MKIAAMMLAMLIIFSAMTANLFAWGPGVHTYIADQLNKKAGWKNVDEMYGAMAPDVINYMFYSPYLTQMYIATHFDFEAMPAAARTIRERVLAHGFVMHNNAWAADYSAHTGSLSLDNHAKGYVIQKAELLAAMVEQSTDYQSLGIPHEITVEICHTMIENSVELLMAQVDRELGKKVVLAARERSNAFPRLLARAYSPAFAGYFNNSQQQAADALVAAETVFRQLMTVQGNTLQQDLPVALDEMAELNAQLAEGFLAQYGFELPEGFDSKALIADLIAVGMVLCADDFEDEVAATVKTVEKNMARYGHRFPQY